jgi:hypothetical protein
LACVAIWRLRSSPKVTVCAFFSARREARSALTAVLRAFLSADASPFGRATVILAVVSVSVSEPESSSSSWAAAAAASARSRSAAAAARRSARACVSALERRRIVPGWFSVLV